MYPNEIGFCSALLQSIALPKSPYTRAISSMISPSAGFSNSRFSEGRDKIFPE